MDKNIQMFNRRPKEENPYIKFHECKLRNDKLYDEYLRWCVAMCEIPMDKYDYIKEITEKEQEIKNLTR